MLLVRIGSIRFGGIQTFLDIWRQCYQFCQFFLSDFLDSKCLDTPNMYTTTIQSDLQQCFSEKLKKL